MVGLDVVEHAAFEQADGEIVQPEVILLRGGVVVELGQHAAAFVVGECV